MQSETHLPELIKAEAAKALQTLFPDLPAEVAKLTLAPTKPEFEGDYSLVLFPLLKPTGSRPQELGEKLGEFLIKNNSTLFKAYSISGGFLNLSVSEAYLFNWLSAALNQPNFGRAKSLNKKVMVEYSSPNTNKPLHFGHLRNIFLGYAMSNILSAAGYEVIKANLINDRGIHICKSMLAWLEFGNGETPESSGMKGDHLVGKYYVRFNDWLKEQVAEGLAQGKDKERAEKEAPAMKMAQQLLIKWEAGDEETVALWKKMNDWVYAGFDKSYETLGVDFDEFYYESNTYLLGKKIVDKGLEKGVLFKKEDGSVWIDLAADGLDQKLLLRSDGTSVYMTQDLGTAVLRYEKHQQEQSIYVIGDEQNYHMQVLKLILQKMDEPAGDGLYHLSYGMVELPTGKLKSREGTVVDADDTVEEMVALAKSETEKAGKTEGFSEPELQTLYKQIGLGALKFYLLRVEPKKKLIFNPEESIDLHGFTASFIQYAHARICSILRKNETDKNETVKFHEPLTNLEKQLILELEKYPSVILTSAQNHNPSSVANYAFALAQLFNSFYDKHSIAKAENEEKKQLRLSIIIMVKTVLKNSMQLLGIQVPDRM